MYPELLAILTATLRAKTIWSSKSNSVAPTALHDDEDVVYANAEEEKGDDESHLAGGVAQQGA